MRRKILTLVFAVPAIVGIFSCFLATTPSAQEKPARGLSVNFDEPNLTSRERLGMRLFFDTRLSEPAGQACASCHDPSRAFTGNNNTTIGVALGSRPGVFGTRDTPTAMYLATAPRFGSIIK
ncbi:MAG: cytochrome-c peroxidase, partial [Burkholderiales bacterium]